MAKGITMTGPIAPDVRALVEQTLTIPSLTLRYRERLEMVKGAYRGDSVLVIARWSGRTERTVRMWLRAFRNGGLDALGDAPRSGRPRRADDGYCAAMEVAVECAPRALGLPFDIWTSARLSAYLADQTGTTIAPSWLRVLLHEHRFANGRPKHSVAHLQDPEEVAACVERLREVGGKGDGEPGGV